MLFAAGTHEQHFFLKKKSSLTNPYQTHYSITVLHLVYLKYIPFNLLSSFFLVPLFP